MAATPDGGCQVFYPACAARAGDGIGIHGFHDQLVLTGKVESLVVEADLVAVLKHAETRRNGVPVDLDSRVLPDHEHCSGVVQRAQDDGIFGLVFIRIPQSVGNARGSGDPCRSPLGAVGGDVMQAGHEGWQDRMKGRTYPSAQAWIFRI